MKRFFKTGVFLGIFVVVAGIAGYLTLRLIVKSEDIVIVPDLVGKDVVYTLGILTDLGLNTKVSGFEYSSEIPKNHVTYQEPEPGAAIKKGRDVRIIVCKGRQTLIVPNLVGVDMRKAGIIVEENGLVPGVVSKTYSEKAVTGEVIGQSLPPGEVVNRGVAIDLLVSLGKRPITLKMPYLAGLAPEDGILILEHSQLNLGKIRYVKKDALPQDVIVGQNPPSGYPVAAGSLVNLTVNRGEEALIVDEGLYLFRHHIPAGFLKKHIRLRINAFGMFYDLCDVFESPGRHAWMLLPKHRETTFFLYEDGKLVLSYPFASRPKEDSFSDFGIDVNCCYGLLRYAGEVQWLFSIDPANKSC